MSFVFCQGFFFGKTFIVWYYICLLCLINPHPLLPCEAADISVPTMFSPSLQCSSHLFQWETAPFMCLQSRVLCAVSYVASLCLSSCSLCKVSELCGLFAPHLFSSHYFAHSSLNQALWQLKLKVAMSIWVYFSECVCLCHVPRKSPGDTWRCKLTEFGIGLPYSKPKGSGHKPKKGN